MFYTQDKVDTDTMYIEEPTKPYNCCDTLQLLTGVLIDFVLCKGICHAMRQCLKVCVQRYLGDKHI